MERFLYTIFGSSVLGVATLGFLWAAPGGPTPPGKAEREWRLLEPISYENLTVFPVASVVGLRHRSVSDAGGGAGARRSDCAGTGRGDMVRDRDGWRPVAQNYGGPSVNQLVLVNRSKRPLLLLAGELVSGGKQDRIIGKDRIVPVGAEPLAAGCILRGARAVVGGIAIHGGENHRASERAGTGGDEVRSRRMCGLRWRRGATAPTGRPQSRQPRRMVSRGRLPRR